MIMRFRKEIAFLLFTLLVVFGAGEMGWRYYLQEEYYEKIRHWEHPLYNMHADQPYQYRLKPAVTAENGREELWSYTINGDGFRNPKVVQEKGKKRILMLGDSYTFGWGVPEDAVFPRVLEKMLNAGKAGGFQIINAGIPGYNAAQEYALLDEILPWYTPDWVILNVRVDDAEPQQTIPEAPSRIYGTAVFWLVEDFKEILNKKYGTQFMVHKLYPSTDYLAAYAAKNPKWRIAKEALQKMARLCRQKGIRFAVFILPDFTEDFRHYKLTPIHHEVREWADEFQIPVFDLFGNFSGDDQASYRVKGDGHPNEKAHQKIAELIAVRMALLK